MTFQTLVMDASEMPSINYIEFDEAALEKLFKEHFHPLCIYCQRKFGFELDVAKEIVHTAFIRLWENRSTILSELSIKAYLSKIITNISLDMLRHTKVKQMHVKYVLHNFSAEVSVKDYNPSEAKQLKSDIENAINELPAQMRKIFELSRYEGLKYAEISSRLNISVKTVETQICRALVKLRQKLANHLPSILLGIIELFAKYFSDVVGVDSCLPV